MSWWRRRKGGPSDEEKARKKRARDEAVSDRRGFFKLSGLQLRDGGTDALRAVGKAAKAFQDAVDGLDEEGAPANKRPKRAGEIRSLKQPVRKRRGRAVRPAVRPPGALPEEAFREACDGCHHCVEACPEGAIEVAPSGSLAGEGTPVLRVQLVPCQLCAGVPCAMSCPTGALVPLPASRIRIGRAVVFRDLCFNRIEGEHCEVCVDQCPIEPTALTLGQDGFPEVDADRCTGCGLCVVQCPAYPAALHVTPV